MCAGADGAAGALCSPALPQRPQMGLCSGGRTRRARARCARRRPSSPPARSPRPWKRRPSPSPSPWCAPMLRTGCVRRVLRQTLVLAAGATASGLWPHAAPETWGALNSRATQSAQHTHTHTQWVTSHTMAAFPRCVPSQHVQHRPTSFNTSNMLHACCCPRIHAGPPPKPLSVKELQESGKPGAGGGSKGGQGGGMSALFADLQKVGST